MISSKLQPILNPVWAAEFDIPWDTFPKTDVLSLLHKGMRPKPSGRRQMIRILADEIAKITKKPGKKALTTIAQKIVKAYPKSFLDEIDGCVVGTGYDSLLKQLQMRFDNMNRRIINDSFKRKLDDPLADEENNALRASPTQKIYLHDKYGCINFMPVVLPDGESEATQEEKKVLLQQKYKRRLKDGVEDLMKDTYVSQRKDIIEKKMNLPDLQTSWPYLFTQTGMFVHFKELTGINIKETIETALTHKGDRIIRWMEEEPSKQIKKIRKELVEATDFISNGNPQATAVICSVTSYLREKEEFIYVCVQVCKLF